MKLPSSTAIRMALNAPIHECLQPEEFFEIGIGNVIVTRRTAKNEFLMAAFLIDVFCLGIKNAFLDLMSESKYEIYINELSQRQTLTSIHPSCARKLVEGAETYARDLGFSPHKDYRSAKNIFQDIEKDACPRSFEFGKDGQPLYFSGPYDSPAFIKNVMKKLHDKCGPDGFDFMTQMDGF